MYDSTERFQPMDIKMKSKTAAFQPPKHLRADTAAWFSSITKEYELDSHHVRLLTKACEAWDRSERAREALAKHGMRRLKPLIRKTQPYTKRVAHRGIWVEPELFAEIDQAKRSRNLR
jgi:hypothetical protein